MGSSHVTLRHPVLPPCWLRYPHLTWLPRVPAWCRERDKTQCRETQSARKGNRACKVKELIKICLIKQLAALLGKGQRGRGSASVWEFPTAIATSSACIHRASCSCSVGMKFCPPATSASLGCRNTRCAGKVWVMWGCRGIAPAPRAELGGCPGELQRCRHRELIPHSHCADGQLPGLSCWQRDSIRAGLETCL